MVGSVEGEEEDEEGEEVELGWSDEDEEDEAPEEGEEEEVVVGGSTMEEEGSLGRKEELMSPIPTKKSSGRTKERDRSR